jgi:phosphohistidine phosphatase
MKTIFVIRHAKAEQLFTVNDFERKLTDNGKADATLVANRNSNQLKSIEVFISSPAKRAKTTAQLFATTVGFHEDNIIYKSELYHAPEFVYYEVLSKLTNDINSVILFAHNPGITDFVNGLSIVKLDNMPTSGCFGFTCAVESWADFAKTQKQFLHFDYPKKSL